MNTKVQNVIRMISTTLQYCTDHASDTAGIIAFALAKTAAETKRALIGQLTVIAEGTSSGVRLNIEELRRTMCLMALRCADAISAYATAIGDNELKALVTYTLPDLDRMGLETVGDICQGLCDKATELIAVAGDYGYVAADVTDLQTAITLYKSSSEKTRNKISDRKTAIANIKSIVRNIVDDLFRGKMDRMVNTLRVPNPDFYSGYKNARVVIDLGSTTGKVRGVCQKADETPLSNVKFTVYETGTTTIVKQVVTNAEGKFTSGRVAPGNYDFKFELNGYKTITETNVHLSAGKELRRKLDMEPGGVSITLTGDVAMGAIYNVSQLTELHIIPQTTMRLTVAGSTLRFYASASNTGAPGVQYFDVAEGQIYNKTIQQWAQLFGFDNSLEDFLNMMNVGAQTGHWEMKWENLGA